MNTMNDNKEEKGFIKGKYYLEINHELNIETKLDYEKEIEKKNKRWNINI